MLSMFEGRLLDRHLRGCASCRAFAADAVEQTRRLREAPLEEPEHPVELVLPSRRAPLRAAGVVFAGALAAAVAAFALVGPQVTTSTSASSFRLSGPRARVLIDVASSTADGLTTTEPVTAPNVGAVRGVFSLPA
jgi:predicted anti-sigma-YlaC factor YlaD